MPILTPEERLGQSVASRYRLNTVLSTGGMGVLFQGTDTTSNTPVAVKMLKPAYSLEKDRVARFLRETRIAGELSHPNIASVLAVWQDDGGVPFLVMELLRGCSLEQELDARGTLPLSEALAIALPIASALSSAHKSGIIHRDVKPGNIFLCRDGSSSLVPKLLDFGIAKTPEDDFETQTGFVLGTPGYMAPEQAQHGECGPFTDIWAVGAVLYRSLNGHPPHGGNSVGDMLSKLVRESVPPLSLPGISKSVAATIDRALAIDPHRRYTDMNAFARALSSAAGLISDDDGAESTSTTQDFVKVDATDDASRLAGRARRNLSALAAATGTLGLIALVLAKTPGDKSAELEARALPTPAAQPATRAPALALPALALEQTQAQTAALGPADVPLSQHADEARPSPVLRQAKRPSAPPRDDGAHSPPPAAPTPRTSFPPEAARAQARDEREPKTGIPVATEW